MSDKATLGLTYAAGREDERARCLAWVRHYVRKHEAARKAMTWGGQEHDEEAMLVAENVESEMRSLAIAIERDRKPPTATPPGPTDEGPDRPGPSPSTLPGTTSPFPGDDRGAGPG